MDDTKINLFFDKATLYKDLQIKVHLTMYNGFVYNGMITEVEPDFFLLDDHRKGIMPVFFLELVDIEKWEEEK